MNVFEVRFVKDAEAEAKQFCREDRKPDARYLFIDEFRIYSAEWYGDVLKWADFDVHYETVGAENINLKIRDVLQHWIETIAEQKRMLEKSANEKEALMLEDIRKTEKIKHLMDGRTDNISEMIPDNMKPFCKDLIDEWMGRVRDRLSVDDVLKLVKAGLYREPKND